MAVTAGGNPGGPRPADGSVLPCGRDAEAVWVALEAGIGPDAHERGCPHCRTARAGLEELASATAALAVEPVAPADGLADRIMSAVRADLGHGGSVALPTPLGEADVSLGALHGVLRFAVDSVDGVRARRCRVEPLPETSGEVSVWMSVSLRWGTSQSEALAEARRRAAAALTDRIGLVAAVVDVEVADVWLDDSTPGDVPGAVGGLA